MKKRKRRKAKSFFRPLFIIVFIFAFIIYADMCMRPSVTTMAKYKLQSLISDSVNNAIMSVIDQTQFTYDDLVEIKKNSNDEIVSISYNSLHMNKLRSELVQAVIDETQKIPVTSIYIPIGNITHIDILQNKGPKLQFKIKPSSFVEADIESVFQNTGINQINHQIFINIKVTANALIPNFSTSINTENKICVAETVIIGKVPDKLGSDILEFE